MELRERLATLRRSRKYSLRELRERIERETGEKIAISYLSELERLSGTPSMEVLTRIAAGYGLTLHELLGPVDVAGGPEDKPFSPVFESFAARRGLDETEKEDLWRVVYRGNRPETEEDWDLLFVALNTISRRRG